MALEHAIIYTGEPPASVPRTPPQSLADQCTAARSKHAGLCQDPSLPLQRRRRHRRRCAPACLLPRSSAWNYFALKHSQNLRRLLVALALSSFVEVCVVCLWHSQSGAEEAWLSHYQFPLLVFVPYSLVSKPPQKRNWKSSMKENY